MKKRKLLVSILAMLSVSVVAVAATGCNPMESIKNAINQARCEHVFDNGKELKSATCLEVGQLEKTCTLCDYVTVEDIAKTAHQEYDVSGKDATCTEVGYKDGVKCRVCETVVSGLEVIPAKGHKSVTDEAVKATCTTSGLTRGSHCEDCGEVFEKQDIIEAKGHSLLTVKGYAATCDSNGKTDGYKCVLCDFVLQEQEDIRALGHDFDDGVVTKAAACVVTGVMRYTCNTCGQIDNQDIPATGVHTYITVNGYPATCTSAGLTDGQKCANCDDVAVERTEIKPTGHIYDNGTVKKAATCGSNGLMRYTCTDCGSVRDETINATGNHKVVTIEGKTATCISTGLTNGQKCSVCNFIITPQEVVDKVEHIYDEGVVTESSSCFVNSIITYTCLECNGTKSEALPQKGPHSDKNNDGRCDYCDFDLMTEDYLQNATFTGVSSADGLESGWYKVLYVGDNDEFTLMVNYYSYSFKEDLITIETTLSYKYAE